MRRPFVVVGPGIVGAERERSACQLDVPARLDLGRAVRRRAGQPGERQGLGHRLDVLKLVLRHHPDEEVVPGKLRESLEDLLAHLRHVGARLLR